MHNLEMRGIVVKWWMNLLPKRWLAPMVARELVGPLGPWPGAIPGDGTCTVRFSLAGSAQTYEVILDPKHRLKPDAALLTHLTTPAQRSKYFTARPCADLRSLP